jgi:aryl carrier-like protein
MAQKTVVEQGSSGDVDVNDVELRSELAAGDMAERKRLLRETTRTYAATLLSLDSLDDDTNLLERGLNSLSAIELTKYLMLITDMEIPLVTIVDQPTPALLGNHLAEEYTRARDSVSQ